MENIFIQTFMPEAKIVKSDSNSGITIYESNSELFALANFDRGGPVTEDLKNRIFSGQYYDIEK